jgi:5'-methylthioadenosine phosphorylase
MKIGILGGSGLYNLHTLEKVRRTILDTPFGDPSDAFIEGIWNGYEVVFLPRHGVGHRLLPSEINHRANIYGFKTLGVERVFSVSAVGSLREEIRPRDIVLPDQYFDRTKRSAEQTFFGNGISAHISFAEPVCPALRGILRDAADRVRSGATEAGGVQVHDGGTYVNMEGPAFSTRAESQWYRSCGFQVIGMTSLAEAKLCREAQICYGPMALVTDYDGWRTNEAPVSVELILDTLRANVALSQHILEVAVPAAHSPRTCSCSHALNGAVMTDARHIPQARRRALGPILDPL